MQGAERLSREVVDVDGLARELNLSFTIAAVLHARGHRAPVAVRRFLDPRLADLTPPDEMLDRTLAAQRIAAAIAGGERICVFGDYDCDGITSTAILTEMLRAVGGDVVPELASRFDGGYGLSDAAVDRILEKQPALLITCDCGTSDHARLERIRDAGVQAIVIDHHLVPEKPLPAAAFLNPHRPDCGFPYKHMASCGLALSVGAAVRRELGAKLDVRRWLDLVAIGTIADVVPLDGDNRALVRAGLRALRAAQRPGIRALLSAGSSEGVHPLTGRDVAFRLAPRINAPGRMGSPMPALELLLAKTEDEARAVCGQIEQISQQRKAQQADMIEQAIADIDDNGWHDRASLVVARPEWNHGVVGIVAGRLADRFAKPVIAIGFDGDVGRGSVRGPDGCRLYDALCAVDDGVLRRFGGHQAAAGLTVDADRVQALRDSFERVVREGVVTPLRAAEPAPPFVIDGRDDPLHVVRDLDRLEPCGEGNPTPTFAIDGRVASAREVGTGHLKLELERGRRLIAVFGAELGHMADGLSGSVRVIGSLRRDSWRGGDAIEVVAERIEH